MPIAYRRLTSRRDPRVYADAARSSLADARKTHLLGANRPGDLVGVGGALIAAEITGPREVDAVDGTATVEELAAMLRARTLSPSDLVNAGPGWQTVREFIPLLEEADARDRSDRLRAWAMRGLLLVLALAGFLAARAYVRFQLGE
jgi:hypothetical protein